MLDFTKQYVFDTHNGDSKLNNRTGEKVTIKNALTEDEADIKEVGNMYHIVFADGFTTCAFEDELIIQ